MRLPGTMLWSFVLAWLLSCSKAFAPVPIQWLGMSGERFVVVPRAAPLPTSADLPVPIRDQLSRMSLSTSLSFAQKSDATIAWDAANLCIEASGDKTGDEVRLSRCTGSPTQLWNVLSMGREKNTQIQLKNTNKCIDVDATGGLHGAAADLHDCENQASEQWTSSSQSPVRHLMTLFLALVALGASSFGAFLWLWQRTAAASMSRRSLPMSMNEGGVCLTESSATNSGTLPAVMALNTAVGGSTASDDIFVDEEAMLADAHFKIPPDQLIDLAKKFLKSRGGFGADPALLSPKFQFEGPVVGPLSKDQFLNAISSVDVKGGFPDFNGEYYNFRVDPFEGNRVWYIARGRGTNTGPLPPFAPMPTGRAFINPPQACSLTYDEQGLVTKYTIGYVMDRSVGNTGGLGGLYGILYAIGRPLPFREAQPWTMSKRYALFNAIGAFFQRVAVMQPRP